MELGTGVQAEVTHSKLPAPWSFLCYRGTNGEARNSRVRWFVPIIPAVQESEGRGPPSEAKVRDPVLKNDLKGLVLEYLST
jgi:hypothetical protein